MSTAWEEERPFHVVFCPGNARQRAFQELRQSLTVQPGTLEHPGVSAVKPGRGPGF